MNSTCDSCGQQKMYCPVCGVNLHQDCRGTWYHSSTHRAESQTDTCPWEINNTHLTKLQIDYLWENLPKEKRSIKLRPHCGFCSYYNHTEQHPTMRCEHPALSAVERVMMLAVAPSIHCPMFENKKAEKKK